MDRLKTLILITTFACGYIYSQSKGGCNNDPLLSDLNTITKCSFSDSKDETSSISSRNSKKVSIVISRRKRNRIIRKRTKKSVSSNTIDKNNVSLVNKKQKTLENLSIINKQKLQKFNYDFTDVKPKFEKCNSVEAQKESTCFRKMLIQHVKRNFKYPEESYNEGIQGRVLVQFVIDEFGDVDEIITRGPYKGVELEKESKRIIKKLPKLSPGKVGNNTVKVKYGIPITFKIPGRKPTNIKEKEEVITDVVNFSDVKHIPSFKNCSSSNDALDCFNNEVANQVNKNFLYPEEAIEKNIEGKVFVYFVINKKGKIVNIVTKNYEGKTILEKSAKEIIENFPDLNPGKDDNGNAVNVKFAFPINYLLN